MLEKQKKRKRRHTKVRAKVKGALNVPRLCVFRSSNHIYAQLVDDEKGKTLVAVSDVKFKTQNAKIKAAAKSSKPKTEVKAGKISRAYELGRMVAKIAQEKKISKVVFDRGGYKYHGRVKAVAEGARSGGLEF